MGVLVLAYVVQTGLIWADPSDQEPLEGASLHGAELWHSHNCQACHQLYGYGGFLGPDLTNAATVHGPEGLQTRLASALSLGPGAMPVIEVTPEEVEALTAWLVVMDATGTGQARAAQRAPRQQRFDEAVSALLEPDSLESEGYGVWKASPCSGCHQPLSEQPGGPPDLSLAADRLQPADLAKVLAEGRPPLMPDPNLAPTQQAALHAWLTWLSENRPDLLDELEGGAELDWATLPWWEYE